MLVDILLSTYNGEKYLSRQIESILQQTYKSWRLLIRDDGSVDKTIDIINFFFKKYPQKIIFINDEKGNLGCSQSFGELMSHVRSEYFMFCDQDDYWCAEKIEISLQRLQDLECEFSKSVPCLVFTDLYVVNQNLEIIDTSFYKFTRLSPNVVNNLYAAMAESVAPGCTMIMNRAVLDYVLPIPKLSMHDYWIMVLTVKYGKVSFCNMPTIKYRQHGNNVVGASLSGKSYMWYKLTKIKHWLVTYFVFFRALPFKVNYLKFFYWKICYILFRL